MSRFWRSWWLTAAVLSAVLLPILALLPLGLVWLWQNGWLLLWLAAGLVLAGPAWLLVRQQHNTPEGSTVDAATTTRDTPGEPQWAAIDLAAWASVQDYARTADARLIGDTDLLITAARETMTRVADHYHPHNPTAAWHFTLPEALLLSERVSNRLRVALLQHVPGAHVVRADQMRALWSHKPAAQRAYRVFARIARIYRVARLANPASALLAEAREQLVAAALGQGGRRLQTQGARIWIEEVGRAAIELYSGRLGKVVGTDAEASPALPPLGTSAPPQGALQVLLVGQVNAGKSSLINALLGEVAAAEDTLPATRALVRYPYHSELIAPGTLELVDTPGLGEATLELLCNAALQADCLLLVTGAHRADRALERSFVDRVRARIAAEPRRQQPPVLVALTHIDRLTPAREWSPPYDIANATSAKAQAIRAVLDTIAADLAVAPTCIVPVRPAPARLRYQTEVLEALLLDHLEAAQHHRALREHLLPAKGRLGVLLRQARAGGTLLGSRLLRTPSP